MYNVEDLVGKVVTIRANGGDEYIGKLMSTDETVSFLTVQEPRVVIINEGNVALIPYALTASSEMVVINTVNVLSVMESLPQTAADYSELVADTTEAE